MTQPLAVNQITTTTGNPSRKLPKLSPASLVGKLRLIHKSENDGLWVTQCLACESQLQQQLSEETLLSTRVSTCGCRPKQVTHFVEYDVLRGAIRRCYDPSRPDYAGHGGKGIRVDPRWTNADSRATGKVKMNFPVFFRDMGPRPSKAHQLERNNNLGPYSPENCEWALPAKNAGNRSTSLVNRGSHPIYPRITIPPTKKEQDEQLQAEAVGNCYMVRARLAKHEEIRAICLADSGLWPKWRRESDVLSSLLNMFESQLSRESRIIYNRKLNSDREEAERARIEEGERREIDRIMALPSKERDVILASRSKAAQAEQESRMTFEDFIQLKERSDLLISEQYLVGKLTTDLARHNSLATIAEIGAVQVALVPVEGTPLPLNQP